MIINKVAVMIAAIIVAIMILIVTVK